MAIALCVRGMRLVDTSGACEGSTGPTEAGSSLIDMGNQFANSQSIGNFGRSNKTRRYHSAVPFYIHRFVIVAENYRLSGKWRLADVPFCKSLSLRVSD